MSYLALARKWRPRVFTELVGQEHVVRALRNALDSGRVHHAFLFSGTRGVGKTTIARIFAKSLNCETGVTSQPCGVCAVCAEVDAGRFVDLIEIDAASHTGVDDVRELIESAQYAPARGRYKVFLIDEVHMLSKNAFNALLKTLEEPPEHVRFLLATTDPQKLPVTVLSRCLQFNLRRLRNEEIAGQMAHILAAEGIAAEPAALALLAHAADGSLRDGLSLLDQAIAHGGGALTQAEVRAMLGTLDQDAVLRLLEAIAAGDGQALFAAIEALSGYVVDYGNVLDALAAALHAVQVQQLLPEAPPPEAALDPVRVQALAQRIAPEDVQLYYQIAGQGARAIDQAPTPRIGFEMSLLRMLAFRPESTEPAPAGSGHAATAPTAMAATVAPPSSTGAAAQSMATPVMAVAETIPAAPYKPSPSASSLMAVAEVITLPIDTAGWVAALDRMGLRAAARQLADNCTVLGCEDGGLRLGLRRDHEILLSELSRRQIEQALSAAVGTPVRLRIEVQAEAVDTPAARQAHAQQTRQSQAETDFNNNAKVQAALAALAGDIVPGSIRPL